VFDSYEKSNLFDPIRRLGVKDGQVIDNALYDYDFLQREKRKLENKISGKKTVDMSSENKGFNPSDISGQIGKLKKVKDEDKNVFKQAIDDPEISETEKKLKTIRDANKSDDEETEPWEDDDPQSAKGANLAINTNEINNYMKSIKGFVGTYAIDQFDQLIKKAQAWNNKAKKAADKIGFIMNTFPFRIKHGGHWVGVIIDPNTIEYFDSFGQDPSNKFVEGIKKVQNTLHPGNVSQFKINRVKWQDYESQRCGYHAMRFVSERLKGKPWKEVTGYSKFPEKTIEKFQDKIQEFGYVK